MTDDLVITVNGKRHQVQATPDTPLLYVLRNELELNGPRFGCGLEQCGACMVLRGAEAVHSCRRPVGEFAGAQIRETLDGNLCRCGAHVRILRAVRRAEHLMWEGGA